MVIDAFLNGNKAWGCGEEEEDRRLHMEEILLPAACVIWLRAEGQRQELGSSHLTLLRSGHKNTLALFLRAKMVLRRRGLFPLLLQMHHYLAFHWEFLSLEHGLKNKAKRKVLVKTPGIGRDCNWSFCECVAADAVAIFRLWIITCLLFAEGRQTHPSNCSSWFV